MRRKVAAVQARYLRALLENGINRLGIERPARDGAPSSDPPEHTALVDPGGRQPGIQRLDRPAGEIDDVVLFAGGRLGPCGF